LIYLNHAAAGPLPRRTRDALVGAIDAQARSGVLGIAEVERNLRSLHARVGRFIGAAGDEIAFLRNTGDGANVVARGVDWREGDEIVISDNEFGANALPWLALREFGVAVRFIETPRERMTAEVLAREMTPRTRVVAVSWVSFGDGYRHDLAALADVAHAGGAVLAVDAIQGLGAFPIDVKRCGIDALYAGGAKWLLSLPGVSLLYVDRAFQDRLTVRWRGWRDVADIWDFLDYDQPLAPDASRYEGGTPNFIGIVGLAASMDVLDDAGVPHIAEHVLELTDHLVERLRSNGAEIQSERSPYVSSGIVAFRIPGKDSVELGRRLGEAKIVTTYRPAGIRIAPHGYNTVAEIDQTVEAMR
jgi:selenocysteine lyase/cysteine desulfurase